MESNKLIADFMGVRYTDDNVYIDTLKEMKADGVYFEQGYMESELKYDSDWNWLMEVIAKIESMGFVTEISGNIERSFALIGLANSNVPISRVGYGVEFMNKKDATYRAVIEFITWYNEQNKQK